MKILGVGIDIIEINRMHKILKENYSLRFLTRVLHPLQLERFKQITSEDYQGKFVASRWAAKQAILKAIGRKQLHFAQTWITNDVHGKPFVALDGKKNLDLLKEMKVSQIHISMTHQDKFAVAYAMAMTPL